MSATTTRLVALLAPLLLGAVVAAPLVVRAPDADAARRRSQDRADTARRLREAGLPGAALAALDRGAVIEELAGGYPDEEDPGGLPAAAGLGFALLACALLGLSAAVALSRRLDADLGLLAARTSAPPADDGAPPVLDGDGLGLRESADLAGALRAALQPGAGRRAGPADAGRDQTRRQRSQLLASMSHDLRSPLTSILGSAELLLRGADGPLDEAAREPLSRLRATAMRLLRLINQILDTARYEAGRMTLELRPTLVAGLLRDSVEELGHAWEIPPDIEVEPTLQPGMAPIEVDRVRMVQAITLLLGEAVQSSGPGVVRLAASERLEGEERVQWLEIEAPGALRPGTATSFARAFRVLAPGDLGLAVPLARALIELHGGSLTLDEGPPARFSIALRGVSVRRGRLPGTAP